MTQHTFTPEQLAVIEHGHGHALVSAVAGSGKTSVLIERIAKLMRRGTHPKAVLVIQFNKDAQLQFADRLEKRLGDRTRPEVRTFHSVGNVLCKRLVAIGKLPPAKVNQHEGRKTGLARRALRAVWEKWYGPDEAPPKEMVQAFAMFIGMVKTQVRSAADYYEVKNLPSDYRPFVEAFAGYEALRIHNGWRFYEDMIWEPVMRLLEEPALWIQFQSYDQLLVDEAQDVNDVQYELIKGIAGDRADVMLVGDIDQTIYKWRGANPDIQLKQFPQEFAPCIRYPMTCTFRYGPQVALMASHVISRNIARDDKIVVAHPANPDSQIRLLPHAAHGSSGLIEDLEPLVVTGQLRDALMLVRYYSHSVPHEIDLTRAGIPYHVFGREPLIYLPEIASLVGALAIASNYWPVVDDLRVLFLEAMLQVPTLFLTEDVLQSTADAMVEQTFMVPPSVHAPVAALAQSLVGKNPRQANKVHERAEFIRLLASGAMASESPSMILGAWIRMTGLIEMIQRTAGSTEDGNEQRANLQAFLTFAEGYENAVEFLDVLGPLAAHDEQKPPAGDYLPIMSIHRAKGLEADRVYVAGLADGIFPRGHDVDAEEERRLAYVAFTRTRKELVLMCPEDAVLVEKIRDLASPAKPGERRRASPYLYDGEIGLCRAIATGMANGQAMKIACRDPGIAARYFREAGISGIELEQTDTSGTKATRKITAADAISPGMKVWLEKHGDCTVVKKLYGTVYQLEQANGVQTFDVLPNNAWLIQ